MAFHKRPPKRLGFFARRKKLKELGSDLTNVRSNLQKERGSREHTTDMQVSKHPDVEAVFKPHRERHDVEISRLEKLERGILAEIEDVKSKKK